MYPDAAGIIEALRASSTSDNSDCRHDRKERHKGLSFGLLSQLSTVMNGRRLSGSAAWPMIGRDEGAKRSFVGPES